MHRSLLLSGLLYFAVGCGILDHVPEGPSGAGRRISSAIRIGPFASRDATHHQDWIQKELDGCAGLPETFLFAPGKYAITNPRGLRVPEGATLIMEGAQFEFAHNIREDGQCFLVEDVSDVTFRGGEIIGQREAWDPGTNVAGVRILGDVNNVRLSNMTFRNLTSNAVGVFGRNAEAPIRNVTVIHVTGSNCCNFYGDYLRANSGPAPGSDRRDQGTVALYHVDGWLVDGCRFEQSKSDGTHFYHCRNGIFVNSVVSDSQMGGYFIEGCEHVLASGNIIVRNGSRGVTIERDSRFCTLENNLIAFSGREGLWAPDVLGVVVDSNIFRENGRKDDGEKDCEIRIDNTSRFLTDTRDIHIEGNIFYTNDHQTATIYLGEGIDDLVIEHNMFRGPAVKCYSASPRAPGH